MVSGPGLKENYVVLARKYRPAQFSDIVGQGHIVRTLMNAIRSQRIHQAYLFTGSRGIGKTSIARIFAKVIRCENSKWEGDSLKSCDACASCKEIATGNGVDVIEIDGASNNGVEAVREIRENAKYLPSTGARKIYIIDEVHMLTTAAFNALLKTLEEPPAHVIFIFATTEPHKIPATILSRCQRFDYRRATVAQLQDLLVRVCQAEKIEAEPAALALVARAAEGGMRDAMSLLDQVISFAGARITIQAVRESIGLIEGQTILGIVAGVFGRKPLDALACVEQAYQRGHDLRVLTRTLIEFLHGAVLARIGSGNPATLELSEEEWKELRSVAEQRSLEEIELIFQVLHHGLEWIARSPQPKVVLDVLLVKCATAQSLVYASGQGMTTPQATNTSSPAPTPAPRISATPVTAPAQVQSQPQARPAPAVAPAAPSSAPAPVQAAAAQAPAIQAPVAQAPAAQAPAAQAPAAQAPAAPKTWENLIEFVRAKRPLLASLLENATCSEVPTADAGAFSLSYNPKDAYYQEQLQSRAYSEQLLQLAKDFFGVASVRIQIDLKDAGESLAAKKERTHKERQAAAKDAVQNHPIIMEARALFGGDLGPIELSDAN